MTDLTQTRMLDAQTTALLRPRHEGSNINTWMGFKHINYLAEEAVLQHLRAGGLAASALYADNGLCLEVVGLETRIRNAFHTDDVVEAVVRRTALPSSSELGFEVVLSVERNGRWRKATRSLVRMQLRHDRLGGPPEPAPEELRPFTVERIRRSEPGAAPIPDAVLTRQTALAELARGVNAYAWCWRIPYFYCHFTERIQMSGYLRLMEEVVDLFLADRGISIKRLLDDRRWIPVVTHSTVSMLDEVVMEEELYTVFTVENVFKNLTYTGRMDNYVLRDGRLLRTATGRITHGYAEILGRDAIKLVEFDERMLAALAGGR